MCRMCSAPRRQRTAAVALSCVLGLWGSCRSVHNLPPLPRLPGTHTVARQQLVIHSDLPLSPRHPLLAELSAHREAILGTLALPASETLIDVYLFETDAAFQTFIRAHYPDFPQRRAFFVERDGRLTVFAHCGDRVAEDVRHELAHGYIHATVPNVPLWLDEGLAEYFEVPSEQHGLNPPHVAELAADRARGNWWPNLDRLEAIHSAAELTQRDYAESWAWVHLLLTTTAARREQLQDYLAALRVGSPAQLLRSDAGGPPDMPERALVEHIASLQGDRSPVWVASGTGDP